MKVRASRCEKYCLHSPWRRAWGHRDRLWFPDAACRRGRDRRCRSWRRRPCGPWRATAPRSARRTSSARGRWRQRCWPGPTPRPPSQLGAGECAPAAAHRPPWSSRRADAEEEWGSCSRGPTTSRACPASAERGRCAPGSAVGRRRRCPPEMREHCSLGFGREEERGAVSHLHLAELGSQHPRRQTVVIEAVVPLNSL